MYKIGTLLMNDEKNAVHQLIEYAGYVLVVTVVLNLPAFAALFIKWLMGDL